MDRAFKINNTWSGFHTDIQQLTSTCILMINCFPCYIIQRVINQYLYKVHNTSVDASQQDHSKGTSKRFFKIPYIGPFSLLAQHKIKIIAKKYCKDLDIRLAFTSFKLSNMFSVNTNTFRSQAVYKFTCAGCHTCYVGETSRHFDTRAHEHLISDRNSHIYKHLLSLVRIFALLIVFPS